MNTFQLSCFIAVANTLSFAQAAKQVNISQPAITNQIKSLENELGAKLFYRTTRMVELTPEGQAFIEDAKSMVAIAERAKLRFDHTSQETIESISIACSCFALLDLLPAVLKKLAATCSNLHPKLYVVPHNQLFKLLETEAVDALFDLRKEVSGVDRFSFTELTQSELVCVCPQNHPLVGRESITRADLESEALIFCNPMNLAPDISNLQWQLAREKSPAASHYCDSSEAAVILAASGLGIAILPELVVPANEGVVIIKMENAPKLSFGMFHKPHPESRVMKTFIQVIKQHFSE